MIVIFVFVVIGTFSVANGQKMEIPLWIKNNAQWWHEGKITDSDFTKGIQYLIQNKIMIVPTTNSTIVKENVIPVWIKNNAGWWANGMISDSEFVAGIQYLISSNIIQINPEPNSTVNSESQCASFTTTADKETCLQQTEYDVKIKNSIASAIPYETGPAIFYYVGSEVEPVNDGKSLLTIHFVVEDTSNQEITMSCMRPESCNYALSDGKKEIPYVTNTLIYGSLTLTPKTPKFVDWTFYDVFDTNGKYSFLINEPWGTGSVPLKIQWK